MAKKFLDVLGDAFEDDVLEDVIPVSQRSRTKKQDPPPRRKKRFTESLEKDHSKPVRRKSLLDSMDDALDNNVFDTIFPSAAQYKDKNSRNQQLETRFSTMITTEVLEKARHIALSKGIRVKDVINKALEFYLDSVDD